MKHFNVYVKPEILAYILLFIGFVSGIVFSFVLGENHSNTNLLWLDNILIYLKYCDVEYADMVFYVLKKRISVFLFFVIICLSKKGKYIFLGGVGVAGGFAGYFLTEFIMAKGVLGSLLFACFLFPHYICYAYVYYKILLFFLREKNKRENINQNGQQRGAASIPKDVYFIKNIAPFAVVIIGILLECYVNPFFVKLFLKIFM